MQQRDKDNDKDKEKSLTKNISQHTIEVLNACSAIFICIILSWAQFIQLYLMELPCPLCLLQRLGFIGIAAGFLLNAYYHPRKSQYLLIMLSALFTLSVGLRQVLLHIVPGTGAYGSPILGIHLYTWSVIFSLAVLVWTTVLLLLRDQQFSHNTLAPSPSVVYKLLFLFIFLITLANMINTFVICGLKVCPSDPTHYIWQSPSE